MPPVLDVGEADELPGGRWMLIRKARGRPWALPTPFVRGPADDPRSAAILPGVRRSYVAHGGAEPRNWDQLFCIYDIFNAVRGAEWCVRENIPWLAGLRSKVVHLLERLDRQV